MSDLLGYMLAAAPLVGAILIHYLYIVLGFLWSKLKDACSPPTPPPQNLLSPIPKPPTESELRFQRRIFKINAGYRHLEEEFRRQEAFLQTLASTQDELKQEMGAFHQITIPSVKTEIREIQTLFNNEAAKIPQILRRISSLEDSAKTISAAQTQQSRSFNDLKASTNQQLHNLHEFDNHVEDFVSGTTFTEAYLRNLAKSSHRINNRQHQRLLHTDSHQNSARRQQHISSRNSLRPLHKTQHTTPQRPPPI